ncbi:unnamed protein product, partial [Pylaiella littoralis]
KNRERRKRVTPQGHTKTGQLPAGKDMSIAPVSQFFILSPRGDTIISKDYRGDAVPGTTDTFFRKVKFWEGGDPPPCFTFDGMNYIYVRKNGLLFAVSTHWNVSPSMFLELLNRLAKVFKDYCGVLSEEAIRKNFILVYELLDETLDYGYPQGTSTETLRNHVRNEPILVDSAKSMRLPSALKTKTAPSSSVQKPVSGTGQNSGAQRNEIFVDILERRLSVLFSQSGQVVNSSIDGCIQMKSYLSGNPELRLALNEDLVVGKSNAGAGFGSVVLDDCNFHECAKLDEFDSMRQLSFTPPDGEFVLLNYRINAEFRCPFRLFPSVGDIDPYRMEVVVIVRADMPETAAGTNVVVRVPVPRNAVSVHSEVESRVPGQSAEYSAAEHRVVWTIKKFQGSSELTLRTKVTLPNIVNASNRKEVGPVSMQFEIPMYNVSNLQVRYLKIAEFAKSYNPFR